MHNEINEFLLKYAFQNDYRRIFPASELDAAEQFRKAQRGNWAELLEKLIQDLSAFSNVDPIISALQTLRNSIRNRIPPTLSNPSDPSDAHVVIWSWPLIESGISIQKQPNWAWILLGGILYVSANWRGTDNELTYFNNALEDTRVTRALVEFLLPTDQAVRTMTEQRQSTETHLAVIKEKIADFDAAISEAREVRIFEASRSLWKEKAEQHSKNYLRGFGLIVCLIVAAGGIISVNAKLIVSSLPRNSMSGEYSYLAVLIVALTFVSAAWIFRLIGRYVIDNFTYATDARQRQAILDTFVNLVGTPEAKMVESERALILAALFRAAPGQSSDDPAPTTLLELIRTGQTGSASITR